MTDIAVCETVTAPTMAELCAGRDRARDADMVELRLDGVEDVDVAEALANRRRPVIVTCRPLWEGGRFAGSEEERRRLLTRAVRLGAEYVDVEWRAGWAADVVPLDRLVLSHHDLAGVPPDLPDRVFAMRSIGAAVVKVAVTAQRLRDCLALRSAVGPTGRHVAIAMGPAGRLTRVRPGWFGSIWTYGGSAAPGQCSTRELVEIYRAHEYDPDAEVYAIGGRPLSHSASPAMHNAAFRECGMRKVYVPLETDDPAEFLEVADALGVAGASITAPLKASLAPHASGLDEVASGLGAVNTLRRAGGGWTGANFDAAGFLAPLDTRGMTLTGRRSVVVGAGGGARAVVWALRSRGADVTILARRSEQAAELARALGVGVAAEPPAGWDVLVNTTPAGTWPNIDLAPAEALAALAGAAPGATVYDLVYHPENTRLLREARAFGVATIGGLEMLVSQAVAQFEWWTGHPAPVAIMAEAARRFVQDQS